MDCQGHAVIPPHPTPLANSYHKSMPILIPAYVQVPPSAALCDEKTGTAATLANIQLDVKQLGAARDEGGLSFSPAIDFHPSLCSI